MSHPTFPDFPALKLLDFANESYPILPEKVMTLIADFLKFKREHGTEREKKVYEDLDILGLVQRLIAKVTGSAPGRFFDGHFFDQ